MKPEDTTGVASFLRMTLPGIASMAQLLAALEATHPRQLHHSIGGFPDQDWLFVASGLIGSGCLGYFLANIYFAVLWFEPLANHFAIDHRSVFVSLESAMRIKGAKGAVVDPSVLTCRDAYSLASQLWHYRIDPGDRRPAMLRITNRLVAITHSLGATVVGSIIALLVWVALQVGWRSEASAPAAWYAVLILWLPLLATFCISHQRAQAALQSIVNTTILAWVHRKPESSKPVVIHYHR